ncbi:porphobilinogen deaminase [Trichodelitschia bisporula]|uniref:Porphobilinogen deaminase n=1 Tax=Trichodelitschia bisporula TaxID=703511 RepID=A0A6G1HLC6_9PEZI|nr:porphobilinogen deaminase [Trichodelitschia bisporula]
MASSSPPSTTGTITIGTRRSALARKQTSFVEAGLQKAWPDQKTAVHAMDPLGDRNKVTALYAFNAKNLWTYELEELLGKGELDLIVHSLKDMPTSLPEGMAIGAILPREDPRDVLILPASNSSAPRSAHDILSSLPEGSVIGTSSLRRIAQLRRRYPQLAFANMRGNVGTRLAKLDSPSAEAGAPEGGFAGLIMAAAGLLRLDLGNRISAYLSGAEGGMWHAVGQGAIGVEVREDDERVKKLLEPLRCSRTERACYAERALMRALEGGCSVPIGVETDWEGEKLRLDAVVVALDGTEAVEAVEVAEVGSLEEAEELGRRVAAVLVEKGAGKILDVINEKRKEDMVAYAGSAP